VSSAGLDMRSDFTSDMDASFDINFAAFPQLSGNASSDPVPDWSAYESRNSPGVVYQCNNIISTGENTALFEVGCFGQEMSPHVNLAYNMMENLPWFQLQNLIEQSGLPPSYPET